MSATSTPPAWPARARLWVIDGLLLGLFMVSVGVFAPLLFHPDSPTAAWPLGDVGRRALMGAAMAVTAVALIYSPLGAASGAIMNPAVTLAFLRLGKIRPADAAGYVAAQFVGGALGLAAVGAAVGPRLTRPPIHYAATVPGRWGDLAALAGEAAIGAAMMLAVLAASNTKRLAPYTGFIAGLLLMAFITFEAPLSGMSLNPARTVASAVHSGEFSALWVYFAGPMGGMLLAAEIFARVRCLPRVHCCKLNHASREVCLHCGCDGPIDFDAHGGDAR